MVRGRAFPIYFWFAPRVHESELDIWDDPGPLRPTDDRFCAIRIQWYRDQSDPDYSAEQLAGRDVIKYVKAGYKKTRMFERRLLDQNFVCVEQREFDDPGEASGGFTCYGDGPIHEIFFAGNSAAQGKFEWMLSNSHVVKVLGHP